MKISYSEALKRVEALISQFNRDSISPTKLSQELFEITSSVEDDFKLSVTEYILAKYETDLSYRL